MHAGESIALNVSCIGVNWVLSSITYVEFDIKGHHDNTMTIINSIYNKHIINKTIKDITSTVAFFVVITMVNIYIQVFVVLRLCLY